jgi:UDP-2-acetamido-2,6-beta-L-arabino-hexul-4-ose reductase
VRLAVTGSQGFLGWHLRCAAKAQGDEVVAIDRAVLADPARVEDAVREVDAVLHLAGVNRDEPDALRDVNLLLAKDLTAAMDRAEVRPVVVYANSIQSGNGTPFGDGKQAAAEHFARWGQTAGATVSDVLLPNLFGEHGRPHYNSVVATFCHQLATGGEPVIDTDRELPLLHAQDAVDVLLDLAATATASAAIRPAGTVLTVSAVLEVLTEFRDAYATGDIPDIADPLRTALFNTYRSFTFPALFPIHPTLREDARGRLFEAVRAGGGQAHVFVSTSRPGAVRGEHFHRRKVERFLVLRGTAEIALRRLFDDEIVRFEVSGDDPAVVDMPTMWAHSITNTGDDELMTMFWANEILDPQRPDTYPEPVQQSVRQAVGGG